jgi:cyclopropane fatty-acyl-phospholipid synthase-like methyltransferase
MAALRRDVATPPDHIRQVVAYYDETWIDYRWFWLNSANRAIHFGYWDESTRSHAESLINMNRALADRIGIGSTDSPRILDAGCGVGGSAVWLAKECGARVVGITPVASQVGRARRYAGECLVDHLVTFEQQDYRRTHFADGSFDVVWALESVCHAPDKRAFLAEARRLLKPGGRLGIVEYFRFGRPYSDRDERVLHNWLAGWAIPDLATGAEFTAWAEDAGFINVSLEDITPHVRPSLRRLYQMSILFYPTAFLFNKLGLRSDVQHGNTRGAFYQYRALQRRLWFEGILVASA